MPATALFFKILRIVLEYGVLFWLVWFWGRVVQNVFRDYTRKMRESQKEPLPKEAFLIVAETEEPSLSGKRFPFSTEISIGRGQDNDIVIPESYVSNHHTPIYKHGSQFVVEDLGSRNHTYVNGNLLTGRAYLRVGDLIRVGMVTLQFER